MIEKTCTQCLLPKPLSEYRKGKGYRDGYRTECTFCERERLKMWRADHPEARRQQDARWRANNPEKKRMSNLQRHDIRRSLDENDICYIEIISQDPCAYCNGPMEHADHIDPVALGGTSNWTNFTSACSPCNQSKAAKPLLLFLVDR
jgi:5-methylcytosine-specific restriction endonuclease McrA